MRARRDHSLSPHMTLLTAHDAIVWVMPGCPAQRAQTTPDTAWLGTEGYSACLRNERRKRNVSDPLDHLRGKTDAYGRVSERG